MKTNKIAQFILAVAFFVSASGFQYSNAQAFEEGNNNVSIGYGFVTCLLYTSPSPRDRTRSRMPSSA